mgnify:CR=1 FL=1
MSDDSEWRYSVDEIDAVNTHSSTKFEFILAVISAVVLTILLLSVATSPSFTATPDVTVSETTTGSAVTVDSLPYRYPKLTVNTSTSNTTIKKEQTIQLQGVQPENITVIGHKTVYTGTYVSSVQSHIITTNDE